MKQRSKEEAKKTQRRSMEEAKKKQRRSKEEATTKQKEARKKPGGSNKKQKRSKEHQSIHYLYPSVYLSQNEHQYIEKRHVFQTPFSSLMLLISIDLLIS